MIHTIYDFKSHKLNPKHQRQHQGLGQIYFSKTYSNSDDNH